MFNTLASLMMAVHLLFSGATLPRELLTEGFRSGALLRMHVVAQDDTADMQQLKLTVRDAVRACYVQHRPDENASMLENARTILPLLAQSARECARENGFDGEVRVELSPRYFGPSELEGYELPTGEYPALTVYLGDAQGHNWWGLVDPELTLRLARSGGDGDGSSASGESAPAWDWSWRSFLRALLNLPEKEAQGDGLEP